MNAHLCDSRRRRWTRTRHPLRNKAGPTSLSVRLTCEPLEDRCTPSALHVWDGGGTTNAWNEAANWVGNVGPSGSGGERLIFPGGVAKTAVDFGSSLLSFNGLTFHAGYNLTGTGTFTLTVPSIVVTAGSTTFGSAINTWGNRLTVNVTNSAASVSILHLGTNGLTKVGPGRLSLPSGADTNGATLINAGTILTGGNLGSLAMVNPRGTLQLMDTLGTCSTPLIVNSASGVQNLGGSNILSGPILLTGQSRFAVGAGQLTITGPIDGSQGLFKTGPGTLVLTGSNSYTGQTYVITGCLQVENANGLGSILGGTTVYPTATLQVGNNVIDLTIREPLTLMGGLTSVGQTNILSNVVLNASRLTVPIRVDGNQLTLNGVLSGTCGSLTKLGGGRLLLAGMNTYTAAATRIQEGAVQALNSSAFGTSTNPVLVSEGAALELANRVHLANPLTIQGDGADSLGALRSVSSNNYWSGRITLADASSIGVDSGGNLILSGTIQEASGVVADLTKLGGGVLWLAGTNTYHGTTQVSSGWLEVQTSAALGPGMEGVVVRSLAHLGLYGTLTLNMPLFLEDRATIEAPNGSTTWNGPIILMGGEATVYTVSGTTLTVNGPLLETSGAYLYKDGPGTLILNGSCSLRRSLVVRGGTAVCNSEMVPTAVSVGGTSPSQTARLTGVGWLYGAVTINQYGTLQPGTPDGLILNTFNQVTLAAGSTYVAALGMLPGNRPSAGQLLVGYQIDLGGATLKLNVSGNIPLNTPLTIISKTSDGRVTGTFAGLDEGALFTDPISKFQFRITYRGGDGNDVQLTRVA